MLPRTALLCALLPLCACAPSHVLSDAELPQAPDVGAVMWSQARLTDPAFKKIGAPSYGEADWEAFIAAAKRLQIATAKLKESFSQGAEWDALADEQATHGSELLAAAEARDAKAASDALAATKRTCKACHKQFR